MIIRILLGVVAAGILGTAANSAIVSDWVEQARFVDLMFDPGRVGVAIAVAVLLPLLFFVAPPLLAGILAFVALTVIPSVLAKQFFGIDAPWEMVLKANAIYAAGALTAYAMVAGNRPGARHRPA